MCIPSTASNKHNKEVSEHSECISAPCLEEANPNSFNLDSCTDFTELGLLSIFGLSFFFF